MKKNILKSIFLLTCIPFCFGQQKKITVIDEATHLPLENVNLNYLEINEGTFTNSDGNAILNLKKNDLTLSMIGYDDIVLGFDQVSKKDTIHLIPSITQLKEVVVNSFNLKKALLYVLENYEDLYVDVPFEKECNFKENLFIDDNLKRLIVSKVNWWDKSYKKNSKTNPKLRLGAIQYNKNIPMNIITDVPSRNTESNSGFMETRQIIHMIYLNSILEPLLYYFEDSTSYITNSNDATITINFETEFKKTGIVERQLVGTVIFDKKTKALLDISYILNNKNELKKDFVKESNKELRVETINNIVRLNFYKSLENKLSLKLFELSTNMNITYDNKIHHALGEQKIYVLKEIAVRKVDDNGLIDLKIPVFQNLPSETIANSNTILLTQKEMEFINDKK